MKLEKILADKRPDFLSSSTFNLLLETKAISIPEKNAENISETKMTAGLSNLYQI